MKHLLNNLSEEEKNRIREQHEGGMKVNTEKFKSLLESKLGNAKPLIEEQSSDCSKLVKVESGMNPGKGLLAQGYKPESENWEDKLSKVVSHTNMFKFDGEGQDALSLNSKCNPAKKSVDWISFNKGAQTVTYLGVD